MINRAFLLLLSIVVLSLFSCKEENYENKKDLFDDQLIVDLIYNKEKSPLGEILIPFANETSLPEGFKGFHNYEYMSFQSYGFNSTKGVEKLQAEGKLDTTDAKKLLSRIYAISAIEGEKQIIILDLNQNHDFSDDQKYVYDSNLRTQTSHNRAVRDSFPFVQFGYKIYSKNKIRSRNKSVRLIPYKDYFSSNKPLTAQKLAYYDLQLVAIEEGYREGHFNIDSGSFKVAVRKNIKEFDFLFRESDKPYYKPRNGLYERYKRSDTIQLGDRFARIDSVGVDLKKLYLRKLDITSLPHPYKENQVIRDYEFTDMDGNTQKMSDLLKDKDYLLMDFWGTWCAPCLALTPDLKAFNKKHQDVAMLGVDFDFKKEPGVEYIRDKELQDWTHTFIERVRNDSTLNTKLIRKLRVEQYPTFILIDKNLKILHRGIGKKGLLQTREILLSIKEAKKYAAETKDKS